MMKFILLFFVSALCVHVSVAQNNVLSTNIYHKVMRVYENHILHGSLRNPKRYFRSVRGGGVDSELDGINLERFINLVNVVSNNYEIVATNWNTYETNEMVRFTTLSAVGYSGYNIYTNFVRMVLDSCDRFPRTNSWDSIRFISGPYGTPMDIQLAMNYENSIVSNLVNRIKEYAIENNSTNDVIWCNKVLSGEWKAEQLEMEAAGGL